MDQAWLVWLLAAGALGAGDLAWKPLASGVTARLRGVSAVNARVVWASGNGGTLLRTVDSGKTWKHLKILDAETADFRDIEAFSAEVAYVLSVGDGEASRIYKTMDGGATWTLQHVNRDPKGFLNALAFWNAQRGLAMGDPVEGRYRLLRTDDGGASWTPVDPQGMPPALPGEGAFAASGTCLVTQGRRFAWFGTGLAGKGRVFRSSDQGRTWRAAETPVAADSLSSGVFSLAFRDPFYGVAVGGDYRHEGEASDNVAFTRDGGQSWKASPTRQLRGFRSAVSFVSGGRKLLVLGPKGGDFSPDGGATWTSIPSEGFHAFSVAPHTSVVWAVGEQGRMARMDLR